MPEEAHAGAATAGSDNAPSKASEEKPAATSSVLPKTEALPAQAETVAVPDSEQKNDEPAAAPPALPAEEPKRADMPGPSAIADAPAPSQPLDAVAKDAAAPVEDPATQAPSASDTAPAEPAKNGEAAVSDAPAVAATNGDSGSKEVEKKEGPGGSGTLEKRKIEETIAAAVPVDTSSVIVNGTAPTTDEPAAKKAKTEITAAGVNGTGGAKVNGGLKKSNSRARKEKRAPPPPGVTARKTRSQGPVEH